MVEALQQLGLILFTVVLPMLLIVGVGYAVQRALGLDMPTLVRMNFYFIVPAIVYFVLVTSELSAGDVGVVVMFHLVLIVALAGVTWGAAALRGVRRDQRAAMLMGTMFYNSGNYGMPMQDLAFRSTGQGDTAMGMQAFVMVTQNIVSFTLGILIVGAGGSRVRHWRANLLHIARFPPLYALAAAITTIVIREQFFEPGDAIPRVFVPIWTALTFVKDAFIAVALATLGAQLALVRHDRHRDYPVSLSVFIRLLLGPALGLGLIYAWGVDDAFIAQVLLIGCATPTAVNAMLLCIEFDNHPNFVARTVFYSTLLSPVTASLVIVLAQGGFLGRLTP